MIRVLDTNVLLDRDIEEVVGSFPQCEIVIPLAVIQELDYFKSLDDNRGKNTRAVIRYLDSLRKIGKLHQGVPLANNSILRIEINHSNVSIPEVLDRGKTDTRILMVAKGLAADNEDVKIITQDICERVIADVLDIQAEDYTNANIKEVYSGYCEVNITDTDRDRWFKDKSLINYQVILDQIQRELYDNEYIIMHYEDKDTLYGKYCSVLKCIVPVWQEDAWGITPARYNTQQLFLMDALLDDDIKLVTAIGSAGSGKTLLSLATGLEKVINENIYDKMVVTRATIPFGQDIGFLPGNEGEKLNPWMRGIFDNLDYLNRGFAKDKKGKTKKSEDLQDFLENKIELEALTFIRGRSIPYQWILVDEAQNLSKDEIKTIISRIGEGSKLILIGDIEQIDNYRLNDRNNGLVHVINSFKGQDIYSHVTLVKTERSRLSELAVKLL